MIENKSYSPERFKNLCREFMQHEEELLAWKCGEYASGNDRLQNFREVAKFLGQMPSEIALAYLLKHVQSIALAVRTGKYIWDWEKEGGEALKQRIADARNYLLLLAACLDEESEAKYEPMSAIRTKGKSEEATTLGRRDQG